MGKPYDTELKALPSTYRTGTSVSVSRVSDFFADALPSPLLVVASGGSLTAAHFASRLYKAAGGWVEIVTPLQFLNQYRDIPEAYVLLLSARGRNPDILAAMRGAIRMEPRGVLGICTSSNTPLSRLAEQCSFASVCEFESLTGRDGFLATNSLLLTMTILARAFTPFGVGHLEAAFGIAESAEAAKDYLRTSEDALHRDTFNIVHGDWASSAAIDLESKLSESGLAHGLLSDYRNFAHGRHYWLHARGATTSIVNLSHPENTITEQALLSAIGGVVPVISLTTGFNDVTGALDLFVKGLHLIQAVAALRLVDPGRPSVPGFGRALYNQRSLAVESAHRQNKPVPLPVRRKMGGRVSGLEDIYTAAFKGAVARLKRAKFGGVVFDYDGTLCDTEERYQGCSDGVADRLNLLLANGIKVGVATGRGKSVRSDLRNKIATEHWGNVTIGYYNGGAIGTLADDAIPDVTMAVHGDIQAAVDALQSLPDLAALSTWEVRPTQITITTSPRHFSSVRQIVVHALIDHKKVTLVESTHSIDVIPASVSKRDVVRYLCSQVTAGSENPNVLCIGDQGRVPGNDAELMALDFALSVDIVSPQLASGWNMLPAGLRGVAGTMWIIDQMELNDGGAMLKNLPHA